MDISCVNRAIRSSYSIRFLCHAREIHYLLRVLVHQISTHFIHLLDYYLCISIFCVMGAFSVFIAYLSGKMSNLYSSSIIDRK